MTAISRIINDCAKIMGKETNFLLVPRVTPSLTTVKLLLAYSVRV